MQEFKATLFYCLTFVCPFSVPTNIGLQTEAVENDSNDEPTRTPVKRIREPESTPRKLQKVKLNSSVKIILEV